MMSKPQTNALAALAFTIIVWGVTPVFVRSVSLALGPYEALIVRLICSALVFIAVLACTTGFKIATKDWPKLVIISLFGMLGYFVLTIFGFAYAPAGMGTLMFSTQPMLIAILASLVGTEKLNAATIIGLVVSFFGSVLLVWDSGMGDGSATAQSIGFGCGLIFLAGVVWAVFVVFSKPLIQTYGALKITGLSTIVIAVPLLPFMSVNTLLTLKGLDMQAIAGLAYLTFLGATAAVVTWNYAAGLLRPSLLGASLYIIPIIAVAAGWSMLDESVSLNMIFAAAIILLGVAVSQWKPNMQSPKVPS